MIWNSISFLLYTIIYLIAPGAVFLKCCKVAEKESMAGRILLSYFIGLGITVGEYYICSMLNMLVLFKVLNPVIVVVALIVWHQPLLSIAGGVKRRIRELAALLVCMGGCFCLSCVYMTFRYGNLLQKPYINLGPDFWNHIGLVATLSHGLPAPDLKASGVTLFYHYFQDLMFGMCENVFSISAFELVIECTPIMVGIVFGAALFAFFEPLKKKMKKWGNLFNLGICFFVFVSCVVMGHPLTGADYQSGYLAWMNYHIFTSVNAGGFAIAAEIAFLVFAKYLEFEKFTVPNAAVLAVLVFVATGAKGPNGLLFIIAMGLVWVLKVAVERKLYLPYLAYMAIASTSFLLAFIAVVHGTARFGQSLTTTLAIEWNGTINRSLVGKLPDVGLLYFPLLRDVLKIALLLLAGFGPLLVYILFATIGQCREIVRTKKVEKDYESLLLGMVVVGAGGFVFVNQSGYSQGYFLMLAAIPAIYLTISYVLNLSAESCWRNWVVLSIIALFGTHLLLADVEVQLRHGLASHGFFGETEILEGTLANVSQGELEGLIWLRENTPTDSLILTDRRGLGEDGSYTADCRFFAYSALSERQMYIEGFSYSNIPIEEAKAKIEVTERIYASSGEELKKLGAQNGIDYVIVSERIGTNFEPGDGAEVCFENEDMRCYRIVYD